jgi:hypothetical protein
MKVWVVGCTEEDVRPASLGMGCGSNADVKPMYLAGVPGCRALHV